MEVLGEGVMGEELVNARECIEVFEDVGEDLGKLCVFDSRGEVAGQCHAQVGYLVSVEVNECDVLGFNVASKGDAEMCTRWLIEVACMGIFAELKGSCYCFGVRKGDVIEGEDGPEGVPYVEFF